MRLKKIEFELHELKSNINNHRFYRKPVETIAFGGFWAGVFFYVLPKVLEAASNWISQNADKYG